MNRLNQTEPATFSILPCWAFFNDSIFSIDPLVAKCHKHVLKEEIKEISDINYTC
jgi:hypothetical protein